MQCEICSRYMESGKKVLVEGSVIVTCESCSNYGKVVGDAKIKRIEPKKAKPITTEKKEVKIDLGILEEVDENYPNLIRNAREKKNMKQDDLAKAISEPVSLIHRMESGKMEPGPGIAKKLQKALDIRLIKKSEGFEVKPAKSDFPKELTLGDMVVIKRRGKD